MASPDVTVFSGPLAVPYPDSVDVAWSDTLSTRPSPPVKGARPKRRKPSAPASSSPGSNTPVATGPVVAVTNPPVSTGTSEATGLDSSSAAAAVPPASGAPSGADTNAAPSAPALQLTVRLSSEEVARLVERWQADVTRVEKALDALKTTTLAGEAADQVAAAKKFLADARLARKSSDYYRACELAEKARVLAEAVKVSVGK